MAELEPEEELVEGNIENRELIAILNGVLATLDLVADLIAEEDEELADRIDAAMDPIADVIEQLGGDLYSQDSLESGSDKYLQ